ncbi:MAG: bphP11 [Myxococcaceae bacterium]|nr:bphP11 [Myxococcaceae bacterium]
MDEHAQAGPGTATRPLANLSAPPNLRRPRVWLLEDSSQQAELVKETLQPLFEVRLFLNSPSLVEALSAEFPDVLMLDWHVPEISGLEVLRFVRQTHDEVTLPVLILTASRSDGAELLQALDAGANDFATKPLASAELRARVTTLLRVRRLHERVRRTEQLLATVLDYTPVGIVVVDPKGRVMVANRRAEVEIERLVPANGNPSDYTKWPILKTEVSPLDSAEQPVARALRGEEAHAEDFDYRLEDGSLGTLQVSYGPVRDVQGAVNAAVLVFQDATPRVLATSKNKARAEFEKQLIGIVSHDLRTPIGAIELGVALLAKDQTLTDRQAKLVERVASSAGRASRMITDLLDFTSVRLGQGLPIQRAEVELHELTRRVVGEVRLAHSHPRRIDIEQTGNATGLWDGDRIAQLLVNLLTNALHYSPRNSTVRVATRGEPERVVLTIQNEGPPIPAELMTRLFLPMQRGSEDIEPSRRSVGLGLFIVDEIARALGGHIAVSSSLEAGTTFTFALPSTAPP